MNETLVEQRIDQIVGKIRQDYEPQKIVLFGSYAHGEPTEDSDIDLFIVKETNARMVDRFVEVKRLIYDPESRIPVSPLVYTPEEVTERLRSGDDFVKEVMREGKVLYEKKD
jgi:predicted nucleotidyltransferase